MKTTVMNKFCLHIGQFAYKKTTNKEKKSENVEYFSIFTIFKK